MGTEPKMNFSSMPDESQGNIQPGVHDMVIVTASKELSKAGKPMLVLQVAPKDAPKLVIYDRYTLFDQKYNPESFGQYKLKKLLKAVDYTPKGDFTIETLAGNKTTPGVLVGLEFSVKLEHEEGLDGKKYLGIKDVESYAPVGQQKVAEEEVSPETFMEEDKEPSDKIKAELEKDDDIV